MSFLKFWKGRPKGASREGFSEDSESGGNMAELADIDEAEKKGRLKHSLSISRSGRYKAKKKERTGFLDKPHVFDGPDSNNDHQTPSNMSPSTSQRGSQSPAHRRTPNNPSSCREGTQISSLRMKHSPAIQSQQPTAV